MKRFLPYFSAALAVCSFSCGEDPPGFGLTDGGPLTSTTGDGGVDASIVNNNVQLDSGITTITNCGSPADDDNDGFSEAEGDCNDCEPLMNPGAYDFPGNDHDEDCKDGPAADAQSACDEALDIASTAARDAAKAIGLCKFTSADSREWGVIDARFTTADGSGSLDSPMQVGLVPGFGSVMPRAGKALLALSSGVARAPDQPGYTENFEDTFNGGGKKPPTGFPKASSACPGGLAEKLGVQSIYNQAALELKIRVPTNAQSLSFDSIFYSYEYPEYICDEFNDFFVALVEPKVSPDGNIVFDSNNDPIGVNTGLLAVCDKSTQDPQAAKQFACEQGTALLAGTGFAKDEYIDPGVQIPFFPPPTPKPGKGGASTGWLTTQAPAQAGKVITLRLAVWDTGDARLDSTVLVDRFAWSGTQITTAVTNATPVLY